MLLAWPAATENSLVLRLFVLTLQRSAEDFEVRTCKRASAAAGCGVAAQPLRAERAARAR